jgi:hypothetical protein
MQRGQVRGCAGKQRFGDKTRAYAAMYAASRAFGDYGMQVYHCQLCKGWHFGHG